MINFNLLAFKIKREFLQMLRGMVLAFKNRILPIYYLRFNKTVQQQLKNPKTIPIVIINFNQLNYLEKLVAFLNARNFTNIVIIDNASTYPPLLEYYKSIENKSNITIHRMKKNLGHLVFWKDQSIFKRYGKGYYVVTDPDIIPLDECPDDFMQKFLTKLNQNGYIIKVGFSLIINDLPSYFQQKKIVENIEHSYWKIKDKQGDYVANIDTTFALYRPYYNSIKRRFYNAVRTQYPYSARHGGWYFDINNPTEEEMYYIQTANSSSSISAIINGKYQKGQTPLNGYSNEE